EFTDPSTNDYSLTSANPVAYQNMGAPGGPEYFDPVPQQITVTPAMVRDLVPGGSVQSPLFLFDEQNLSVQNGAHASSNSWKPALAMNEAAYHVVVDLGKEYHLSAIDLHDMEDTYNFTIEYGDASNWATLFVDPCSSFNAWSKNETDATTRFLRLSMSQNVFAAVNEIILYGTPVVPVVQQIVVLPQMVTDLVQGGSVNSPLFLFDEQNIDVLAGAHAISTSWKPDYSMKKASYHVMVDLGRVYHLSEIHLHDMNDTKNFTVEYGDGTTWTPLFVDPCDTFNTWSINTTDVSTRYLRLSMYESVFAAVNEIFIYGYPVESNAAKSVRGEKTKNTSAPKSNFDAEKLQLFPNPVHEKMEVQFPPELIGKSNLVIKDLLGKTIYRKEVFTTDEHSIIELNDFQLPTESGVYVLSLFNESGGFKTLKFIKTN
ncbi:MAG: T9SS type A sorting domain-containing protein, partial [Flavobacteriaceae bacterium]|nr:T9SS type A sorting domain-containing protein [Flavobacteriaceae bacterium]